MRTVSIIGAGHAGTLLAVGLQRAGYQVNLYSDKTAEEILDQTSPTGTAAIFANSVATERRLGAADYADAPAMDGVHVFFSPAIGTELVAFGAPLEEATGHAVDVRLKSYDRMRWLEGLGGKLVIESVTAERLDDIASGSDLTVVATGKFGLSGLFPRDPARSVYDRPQRHLAMILVRGIPTDGSAFPNRLPGLNPVCFNLFGDAGEIFWVPFLHKSGEHVWCLVFEARPGSPFDRWADVDSPAKAFDTARGLAQEFAPWDWPALQNMEPIDEDPFCWLKGAFPPGVRTGSGLTPGGRVVMSLGDSSVGYDPIAGQGAGSGIHQVGHYFDRILERGDQPFDREWIDATFEGIYAQHIEGTFRFTNTLLDGLDETGARVVTACFADQRLAAQFAKTFNRPPSAFPWIKEPAEADAWIRRHTGREPAEVVQAGNELIGAGQQKQQQTGAHFARVAP